MYICINTSQYQDTSIQDLMPRYVVEKRWQVVAHDFRTIYLTIQKTQINLLTLNCQKNELAYSEFPNISISICLLCIV